MGKKSVKWDRDPEIMTRLTAVAQLMIRGVTIPEIALAMDVCVRTASRDVRRVKTLWRRQCVREIDVLRQEHRARLDWLFQQSLDQFMDGKPKEGPAPRGLQGWLKLAADIESELIGLDGAAKPAKLALTDPSGGKEYGSESDRQRIARAMALLDVARARFAADKPGNGDLTAAPDVPGVGATQPLDKGQG